MVGTWNPPFSSMISQPSNYFLPYHLPTFSVDFSYFTRNFQASPRLRPTSRKRPPLRPGEMSCWYMPYEPVPQTISTYRQRCINVYSYKPTTHSLGPVFPVRGAVYNRCLGDRCAMALFPSRAASFVGKGIGCYYASPGLGIMAISSRV